MSPSIQQKIEDMQTGSTNQVELGKKVICETKLPLAPLHEQSRIVSRIEELFAELDKGEEALSRVQKLIERYRQSVLKAAVTGELTREWREKNRDNIETGEELLARILKARRKAWEKAELAKMRAKGKMPEDDKWKQKYKEPQGPDTSDLPELPEGWVWCYLSQLGEFGRGKSKHRPRNDPKLYGGAYPFIQTGIIRNSKGKIKLWDTAYNEKGLKQSKLWPKGTVCITIAANIAESGILEMEACFPDSVVGLVPSESVSGEYIEFFIRTIRSELDSYAPATAQKNINLAILNTVAVPIPSETEQAEIYSKVHLLMSTIDKVDEEIYLRLKTSLTLRQSILKAAFSGKLVPQDPNDEPASELLKRIAAEKQAGQAIQLKRRQTNRKKAKPKAKPKTKADRPATPADIGTKMKAVRKEAGLTQVALAKATGINQVYISQIENNKRTITPAQAKQLAGVLGLNSDELVTTK